MSCWSQGMSKSDCPAQLYKHQQIQSPHAIHHSFVTTPLHLFAFVCTESVICFYCRPLALCVLECITPAKYREQEPHAYNALNIYFCTKNYMCCSRLIALSMFIIIKRHSCITCCLLIGTNSHVGGTISAKNMPVITTAVITTA